MNPLFTIADDKKRQDQPDELKAAVPNTQSARGSLQALAEIRSSISWTAPTISYLVIAGFFVFLIILVWLYKTDAGNANSFVVQIINISVGALTAAFATVVNFWLGSSAGSQNKDAAAISLQHAHSEQARAAIDALGKRTDAGEAAQPTPTPKTAEPAKATAQVATA